jgi:hypothetical protein
MAGLVPAIDALGYGDLRAGGRLSLAQFCTAGMLGFGAALRQPRSLTSCELASTKREDGSVLPAKRQRSCWRFPQGRTVDGVTIWVPESDEHMFFTFESVRKSGGIYFKHMKCV